jgi:hypothetical protein
MSHDVTPEYAKSLGRIGGQLLSDNLLFQGQDIQFDTDLLYLDVANKRIGINNFGTSPAELYLGGDKYLQTVNLIVDGVTSTDFGWVISTNNIQRPSTGLINLTPVQSNPRIIANGVGVRDISITDTTGIYATSANTDIQVLTNGSGISVINGNLHINNPSKLMYVTGNVLVDGDYIAGSEINFGDQTTDTINFSAEQAASLVPDLTATYNIGSNASKWNFAYARSLLGTSTVNTVGTLGGITLRGNSIFSANNALDITITTPTATVFTLADGEESLSPVVDIIDGAGAFDSLLNTVDGGPASILYDANVGNILFNGLVPFTDTNINNNTFGVYNAPYYLLSTNDGYVNFAGTNGVAFPIGNTSQRNTEILGTTRYNTESLVLEIYNGTTWQNVNGDVPLATEESMSDEAVIYDLMLG